MGQRLPQANLMTGKYTDTQLIARAQQVHDGIDGDPTNFPVLDLPVDLGDLQDAITGYISASAAAIKGTKAQTATKKLAKQALIYMLKELAIYVTQVAQQVGTNNPALLISVERIILSSGFAISINPTRPVAPINGIKMPQVRRAISMEAGTLKILTRQYTDANRNTLLWQVNYRTSEIPGTVPVPAGPWQTQTFTGQNQILLTGLESGKSYDYQVAAVGGRDIKRNSEPPVNYTQVESVVII